MKNQSQQQSYLEYLDWVPLKYLNLIPSPWAQFTILILDNKDPVLLQVYGE